MSAQGGGVAGTVEYDVAHIDLDQYRQLRALVLAGRAKARIVVETLDAPQIVGEDATARLALAVGNHSDRDPLA